MLLKAGSESCKSSAFELDVRDMTAELNNTEGRHRKAICCSEPLSHSPALDAARNIKGSILISHTNQSLLEIRLPGVGLCPSLARVNRLMFLLKQRKKSRRNDINPALALGSIMARNDRPRPPPVRAGRRGMAILIPRLHLKHNPASDDGARSTDRPPAAIGRSSAPAKAAKAAKSATPQTELSLICKSKKRRPSVRP